MDRGHERNCAPVHRTRICHGALELWRSLQNKGHALQLPVCLGMYIKRADK